MKRILMIAGIFIAILVAMTAYTSSEKKSEIKEPTASYYWVRYNCGFVGSAQPASFSQGMNVQAGETLNTGLLNFGCCTGSSGPICAVRFDISELEVWPGLNGHLRPKAGVNPWDGAHQYAYCNSCP